MEAALVNAQGEVSRACDVAVKGLRAAAEKELATARVEVKRREEAVEHREQSAAVKEAELAQREKQLQAKLESRMTFQLALSPTPSRSIAKASPAQPDAEDNWGLSPLRSVRQSPGTVFADSEVMLPSPAPSSSVDFCLTASPLVAKPRPAGVPQLRLAQHQAAAAETPARFEVEKSPRLSVISSARSLAGSTSRLKAMFEDKTQSSNISAPSVRRAGGASSSIAAAASALQAAAAAAGITKDSSSNAAATSSRAVTKLSLQDLLRLDEEKRTVT